MAAKPPPSMPTRCAETPTYANPSRIRWRCTKDQSGAASSGRRTTARVRKRASPAAGVYERAVPSSRDSSFE
jgi:hypothetical protein